MNQHTLPSTSAVCCIDYYLCSSRPSRRSSPSIWEEPTEQGIKSFWFTSQLKFLKLFTPIMSPFLLLSIILPPILVQLAAPLLKQNSSCLLIFFIIFDMIYSLILQTLFFLNLHDVTLSCLYSYLSDGLVSFSFVASSSSLGFLFGSNTLATLAIIINVIHATFPLAIGTLYIPFSHPETCSLFTLCLTPTPHSDNQFNRHFPLVSFL